MEPIVKFWDSWLECKAACLVDGWNVSSQLTCRFQWPEARLSPRLSLKGKAYGGLDLFSNRCNPGAQRFLCRVCTLSWTPGRSPAQSWGGADLKPYVPQRGVQTCGAQPPVLVQMSNTLICACWSSAPSLHYHSNVNPTHFQIPMRAVPLVGVPTIGERPEYGQSPMT